MVNIRVLMPGKLLVSPGEKVTENVRFGNFEVINDPDGRPLLLGKGTFGRTYQARHCYLDTIVTGPNMNAPLPGTARLWGKTRSRACEKKDAWPRSTGSTVKSREARPRPVYSAELCILKSCGITRIKFDKHHHSVRRVRLASPGPPHRANGHIQSR